MGNYTYLLEKYRSIWNNRLLQGDEDEIVLKEAIIRELRDENAHPRVRKQKYEKFFFAIKRINESMLSPEDKLSLITLHIELLSEIG